METVIDIARDNEEIVKPLKKVLYDLNAVKCRIQSGLNDLESKINTIHSIPGFGPQPSTVVNTLQEILLELKNHATHIEGLFIHLNQTI
jgi:hypothetical protein